MATTQDSLALSPEQIEDALTRCGTTIDWATGFFVALHTGPDALSPSDWIPQFTPEAGFADNQDATATMVTLLHLYNRVGKVMGEAPRTLCPDSEDVEGTQDWCSGYYFGSRLHAHWQDDDIAVMVVSVLGILGGDLPTRGLQDPDGKPMRDVEGWLERQRRELRDNVGQLWNHFAPARRRLAVAARDRKQIGRNDACPCGSGKKYKKCCLDAVT